MKFSSAPWNLFRGKRVRPRRKPGAVKCFLALEILEDRLALSNLPTGPQPIGNTDWRNQTFSIETQTVANASGNLSAAQVQTQAATPGQGEGFGQDIGLNQVVANYPYKGDGYSVAIIDTGIDYNNPALGGGWGKRVIAGYNFVNNTSDPMDDNGHGTHVAGIIGSSDPTYTGIAPDVDFIALKVLDSTGSGTFGAVDEALQWVATHQAQYHIVAVNMSLGSGNYTINPFPYLENDFSTLKSEGVFIACASGNSFYSVGSQQGLAYPAISPQVVSVGAVWDGNFGPVSWVSGARDNSTATDQIASFTQRSNGLDILAPGAMITSTYLNDTFQQMAGTSMATPVVVGAAVLLYQALDARGQSYLANQDYILGLMQSTGATIVDNNAAADNVTNTGLSFQRLNLFAALNKLSPVITTPPTLGTIPNQTMTAGLPLIINLSPSSANGSAFTYQAQATGTGNSQAFIVGQLLGLGYGGSYFINSMGQNEKWVLGANSQWYCLLPDGELRRWMGNATDTLAPAALVATLTPAIYNDPTQLWTSASTNAPNVTFTFNGNQLTVQCDPNYLGTFTVQVSVSDGISSASQSFTVDVSQRAPSLGTIANQVISHSQKSLTLNLNVGNPDNDALSFSAQVVPPGPSISFAFAGNQLTITPAANVVGTFTVQVTLTDGLIVLSQTFTVTVTDTAPVLGAIPNQTVIHGRGLVVNLPASDAAGDPLVWTAQTVAPSQNALNLEQSLGLIYTGNYWTNYYGQNEKWLRAGATGPWYCIMPNGEVRLAGGSAANLLAATSLVATLDGNYYLDPSLLWNAPNYVVPQVGYAITGTQLTITPNANFVGTFLVAASATDGALTTQQSFFVTATNAPPVLNSLPNQTMSHTQGTLNLVLNASDPDGDPLTFTAQALSLSQLALNLKQSLGLTYTGNYWTNYYGAHEKWLRAQNGPWYCLMPNGELRLAGQSAGDLLAANSLIATLDSSYYQDPSLLWNAQGGQPVPVNVTVTNNQLAVQPTPGFLGTFAVLVSASDGIATVNRYFSVSVTNAAPVVAGEVSQNQSISSNQNTGPRTFNFSVSDADGDPVTLTAQAVALNKPAYDLQRQYGFTFTGNYMTGAWGSNEKWLKAQDGTWYCILPNGEVRQDRGTMANTLLPDALIATLDPSVYNDPSLLWNAQTPASPQVTVVLQGNQVTVTPVNGYQGTFYVEIIANDGFTSTKKDFLMTF